MKKPLSSEKRMKNTLQLLHIKTFYTFLIIFYNIFKDITKNIKTIKILLVIKSYLNLINRSLEFVNSIAIIYLD